MNHSLGNNHPIERKMFDPEEELDRMIHSPQASAWTIAPSRTKQPPIGQKKKKHFSYDASIKTKELVFGPHFE